VAADLGARAGVHAHQLEQGADLDAVEEPGVERRPPLLDPGAEPGLEVELSASWALSSLDSVSAVSWLPTVEYTGRWSMRYRYGS